MCVVATTLYPFLQVAEVLDEVQEGIDEAQQIGDVLSQGLGAGALEDDADLMAELDEMEQEELASTLLEVPQVPQGPAAVSYYLPAAPTAAPAAPAAAAAAEEDEDARALRELEASMLAM